MKTLTFGLPVTLFLSCAAAAAMAADPVVHINPAEVTRLRPGTGARAHVVLTIDPGYHVQSNPPSADYLIPTELKLKAAHGVKIGPIVYPKGQSFKLEGSSDVLSTYMGTVDLAVPLRLTGKVTARDLKLEGTLRYQACDEKACFAPITVPVEVPVRVVAKAK